MTFWCIFLFLYKQLCGNSKNRNVSKNYVVQVTNMHETLTSVYEEK